MIRSTAIATRIEPTSAPTVRFRTGCSAPSTSSHQVELLSPILGRAEIAECLMRSTVVVPADPSGDLAPRLAEVPELLDPDALLLQTSEEALDHAILLGRVGLDELLTEPVVAAGGAETSALKDESVVAAHNWSRSIWPQRSEALDAGTFECSLGFLRPRAQRELVANDLAIVTVDHRRQMPPAVAA